MPGARSIQTGRRMRWLAAATALLASAVGLSTAASAAPVSADLSITLDHTPAGPRTGDLITFTLVATNAGPDPATDVVLAQQLEYYFTVESATSTGGTCSGDVLVVCRVSSLPAGQSVTATIVARSVYAGLFDELAVVSSSTADPDHADREAHDRVVVEQGPSFALQYAGGLFRDILGRPGTASELTYWANRVDQLRFDRLNQVSRGLLSSSEYRHKRIAAAYLTLLSRMPSAGDQAYWAGFVSRGGSFEQMATVLVGSGEFARHAGAGSDLFVNAAYRGILGRGADPGARQYWGGRLASGVSHGSMAHTLQFSQEGLNRIVTARFQAALHVNPTDFDRYIWLGNLRQGVSAEYLWSIVFASGPYQSQFVESQCCVTIEGA